MSVDKFGRHESSISRNILRGPPGEGFLLTRDGQYDIKGKRLCNVGDPIDKNEVANLKTIHSLTLNCETINKMFDAKNKRISRIANPEHDTDAANKKYVLEEINKLKQDIQSEISKLSSLIHGLYDPTNYDSRTPSVHVIP
jgi:hypothetical protein